MTGLGMGGMKTGDFNPYIHDTNKTQSSESLSSHVYKNHTKIYPPSAKSFSPCCTM